MKIYEGVIYEENFKTSLCRKIIEILFISRQEYKDECNDFLQKLVEVLRNNLFGENTRRDTTEE